MQPLIDELENIFGKFSSAGCKLIDEEVEDAEVVGTENDDNEGNYSTEKLNRFRPLDEKKEEKKRSQKGANKPAAEAKDEQMKEEPAEGVEANAEEKTGEEVKTKELNREEETTVEPEKEAAEDKPKDWIVNKWLKRKWAAELPAIKPIPGFCKFFLACSF